ncbi:hypothetical protein [Tsukamurella sp. PLM1]|nr:hypothetical protein [Tsukamurella sp. PLM1]
MPLPRLRGTPRRPVLIGAALAAVVIVLAAFAAWASPGATAHRRSSTPTR